MGAFGHVVDSADEAARHFAQAGLEAGECVVGGDDDVVEVLGIGLEPGQQRIGVVVDDEGRLVQRRALVLDAGDEGADALLVAAEGALDGGDFLVDDFFQNRGALHGMLDAADQQVDFGAHGLRDGGEAFGGDVLRADEAHGRLVEGFRHLAHVGGPPEHVSRSPDDGDRNQQQGKRLQDAGKARRGSGGAGKCCGIGEEPAAGPQGREDEGDGAIGCEGRAAAEPRQHHGGAGIVLVGGAAAQRLLVGGRHAGSLAPGRLGIGGATVWTARLGGICHNSFPALSTDFTARSPPHRRTPPDGVCSGHFCVRAQTGLPQAWDAQSSP